ncbi:MAG TPA: hypothetical protein DIU35_08265 [Candidatus Latescibacteria bacterium]|nr:hypothetical protein [Gemmatimonadota bacterium]HCR17462.1 hypothetical protein [Candidatus Latescibacterota bacterium]
MTEPYYLFDLNTLNLDGFEVLMRMKERGRFVPVIVMAGHFPEEVVEDRLERLQVVVLLRKPVRKMTLLNSVNRVGG